MIDLPTAADLLPRAGAIRTWLELYGPLTEAPEEAHLGAALALISAVIGWKAHIRWGESAEPCSLSVLLEGRSATARKTTVANNAHSLARSAMEGIEESARGLRVRSVALGPALVEELCQHLSPSCFQGEDERVFCHIETGGPFRRDKYQPAYDVALKAAGVEGYVRPFHDLRHSSLTNGAAAGEGKVALMARAGHSSMATTKRYLHLAGVIFRDEAERLERRLLAGLSTEPSTDLSTPSGTWDDGARLNGAESDASRL